jgi:hypothetical protein
MNRDGLGEAGNSGALGQMPGALLLPRGRENHPGPWWHKTAGMCRYCCKNILSILSRNIDSRSGANAQQRFKKARAPIRSLQISISQSLFVDFCNTSARPGNRPGNNAQPRGPLVQ